MESAISDWKPCVLRPDRLEVRGKKDVGRFTVMMSTPLRACVFGDKADHAINIKLKSLPGSHPENESHPASFGVVTPISALKRILYYSHIINEKSSRRLHSSLLGAVGGGTGLDSDGVLWCGGPVGVDEEARVGVDEKAIEHQASKLVSKINKLCKKASEATDIRIKNGDTVRIEWQTDPTDLPDPDFEYEAISRIVGGYVVWFVNGKKVSELPLTSVQMRDTNVLQWRQRYETIDMRFAVSGYSHHHTFEIVEVSVMSAFTHTAS